LFGNTAGLMNNINGYLNVSKAKPDQKITNNKSTHKLKTKQYLIVGYPYQESTIRNVITKYNQLIEDDEFSYPTAEYEDKIYSRHINQPQKYIPEIGKLLPDNIANIIKGYYNASFEVKFVFMWRNYHIPNDLVKQKEFFSNYWHCDQRNTDLLKLFIPLCEITDDTGPSYVMSQQRTNEIIKSGFGSRTEYGITTDELEDPKHIVKVKGKPGLAYFANPQLCLHRASNPTKGNFRDMLCFVFAPSSKPFDQNWLSNYIQDSKSRYGEIFKVNKKKLVVLYRKRATYSK